jgi:FkbM family methyltransferase
MLIPIIARVTRQIQAKFPSRPVKGLTRFANLLRRWHYAGAVQFVDGSQMFLDNQQGAERWLMFSGNYHPALTYTLQRFTKPGAYCLDVGANLGFYTVKFGQWVGSNGRVAAFEANPAMVARIQQNIALNHFSKTEVVQKAVHDHPDTLEFYISASPGKSSLHTISNTVQKITVQAITLDDYLKDWTRLDVIKMDIEGNDCLGLIGARESIRRFRPFIIFEYRFETPIEQVKPVFDLFAELGYTVHTLGRNGQLTPFDWRSTREQHGHTDIVCQPAPMTAP